MSIAIATQPAPTPAALAARRTASPATAIAGRPCSRRHALRVLAAAGLALAMPLGLTGCEATHADVYAPTSVTVHDAAGTLLSTTTYELDEHGNAVRTTIEAPGAETVETTTDYDAYGIPVSSSDGRTVEAQLGEKGAPAEVVTRTADGSPVSTETFTYLDIEGRIDTYTLATGELAASLRFDKDGWPLDGTLETGGIEHTLRYVYEVTDTGAVTVQHVETDGVETATFSYAYDDNQCVAQRTDADGTTTSYTYAFIEDPSPYAMVRALARIPELK